MWMDALLPLMWTTYISALKSQKWAPDPLGLEVQMSVICDEFRMEPGSSGSPCILHEFLGNTFLAIFRQSTRIKLARSEQMLWPSLSPSLLSLTFTAHDSTDTTACADCCVGTTRQVLCLRRKRVTLLQIHTVYHSILEQTVYGISLRDFLFYSILILSISKALNISIN